MKHRTKINLTFVKVVLYCNLTTTYLSRPRKAAVNIEFMYARARNILAVTLEMYSVFSSKLLPSYKPFISPIQIPNNVKVSATDKLLGGLLQH